jgi:hypothetical protein
MPHTDRQWADRYRWALAGGSLVVMVLALTGFLGAAVAAGAVLLPAVYFLYLLESRVWQSAAGPVVLGVIALPAVLAVLVQSVTSLSSWGRELSGVIISMQTLSPGAVPLAPMLGLAVFTSAAVVLATNAGPVLLARRPMFDDLLDGFTFGVAAGFTYAAVETAIAFREVFLGPALQSTGPLPWGPVLVQAFLIKPVIYALTAGVAISAFSGKGEGYDGFRPAYVGAVAIAMATIALYWLGLHALQSWPSGPALALIWGLVVSATVVLRARRVLQDGLLEKAIQAVRAGRRSRAGPRTPVDCQECEMPLLPASAFCAACGVSLRATRSGLEARSSAGAP